MGNIKNHEEHEYEIMKSIRIGRPFVSNYVDVRRRLYVVDALHHFSSKPKSRLVRQHNQKSYVVSKF